tara:strand:+ start:3717 stop:4472 length:756 start_codon:yes stop_codon:yes gene_type:complete
MAHPWFETNMVVKELSKVGSSSSSHNLNWNSHSEDFTNALVAHHTTLNSDRRAVAIGNDIELHWWTMLNSKVAGWDANVFASELRFVLFQELAQATNYLLALAQPSEWLIEKMNDRSKNVTVINNEWLYNFEQFFLTIPEIAAYSDTQYSTITPQSILAGTGAGTYDFIQIRMKEIIDLNTDKLDAYLAMLSVGGLMQIEDTGSYGQLYGNHSQMFWHPYTKFNRHIAAQSNLTVFHLATDDGTTLIRRDS